MHPHIDRQRHRPAIAGRQRRIEGTLGTGQTVQIAIRITHHMCRQPAAWIDAARFNAKIHPRQTEREHRLALARRQIALHPDKAAMRGQLAGHRFNIEIRQDGCQRVRRFGRIPDQGRVGKQRIGLQGRRQHLAGAVKQIAAHRFGGDRARCGGMARAGDGQFDGAQAEHGKTERQRQTDDAQPATGRFKGADFSAFDAQ